MPDTASSVYVMMTRSLAYDAHYHPHLISADTSAALRPDSPAMTTDIGILQIGPFTLPLPSLSINHRKSQVARHALVRHRYPGRGGWRVLSFKPVICSLLCCHITIRICK